MQIIWFFGLKFTNFLLKYNPKNKKWGLILKRGTHRCLFTAIGIFYFSFLWIQHTRLILPKILRWIPGGDQFRTKLKWLSKRVQINRFWLHFDRALMKTNTGKPRYWIYSGIQQSEKSLSSSAYIGKYTGLTVMVPTFSDWQISLTFPAFLFHFTVFFSMF